MFLQDVAAGAQAEYVVDVLLDVAAEVSASAVAVEEGAVISVRPRSALESAEVGAGSALKAATLVVHVVLDCLSSLSAVRLNLPKDITTDKAKASVMKSVTEVKRRFSPPVGTGIPLLDFVADLAIPADTIQPLLNVRDDLQQRIEKSAFNSLTDKESALEAFRTKTALIKEAEACASKAKESQAVAMREELKKMKRVLRRLDFITADNVLALKGRFSCELSTADELVATNMVFDGAFNDLSVPQVVALLSCFVHKEENKDAGSLRVRPDMQAPIRVLQAVARAVAKVCAEAKLQVDEEEYVNSFNPGLVDVTYAWW
jgi:ATP-dependent RNA helicase DOB1